MKKAHRNTLIFIFLIAFLARFGLGWFAHQYLPTLENGSDPQKAGYLFFDAYHRDAQAFDLAASDRPLINAFNENYSSDQYGGMLWLIAFIYRIFDLGHLPLVPLFFIALFGAIGVFFTFFTFSRYFTKTNALIAALVFALYPESVLLGAAQMREPLLITLGAAALYTLTLVDEKKISAIGWTAFVVLGSLFISPGISLIFLLAIAGWFFISRIGDKLDLRKIAIIGGGFLILVLAILVVLTLSWQRFGSTAGMGVIGEWARRTTLYNTHLLKQSSGIVQVVVGSLPSVFILPFVVVYGSIQPVLPAILFEPGELFWKIIGFFRSIGWYVLFPLFLSFPFIIGKKINKENRTKWIFLFILTLSWILLAAARGGGDQWDNPRYRTMLLPFLMLFAGFTLNATVQFKGSWLSKIIWVEISSLAIFTHWYSWRYTGFGYDLGIRNTIMIAIVVALIIIFKDAITKLFRKLLRL